MNKNDAVKQIIQDYMRLHSLNPADFARKCEVSKSFISKILNSVSGKLGISFAYLQKLAIGMNMETSNLQKLIENYQVPTNKKEVRDTDIDILKFEILKLINKMNDKELQLLHSIILDANAERLTLLHTLLKNMK